ncbi:hypothetical protein ACRAVF_11940 [Bradyrhizobium oligotrophicum S58]
MRGLFLAVALLAFGLASDYATAGAVPAPGHVSNVVFVMPDVWFVLPEASRNDDTLLFRRYSVVMARKSFDSLRAGKTARADLIGSAGTLVNAMIYTCRKVPDRPDYLTFHMPPTITPVSFGYEDRRPQVPIEIVADTSATRHVVEYIKGDLFVDAVDTSASNLLRLMQASEITIRFGARKDSFKLSITDRLGRIELARAVKEMLPLLINAAPGTLRSFSNTELRAHCLAYRGAI